MAHARIESELEPGRRIGLPARDKISKDASRLRIAVSRMARATRSGAAQQQEKDKHSDSSRQKHASKKRKRASLPDNDDQPPLKQHQPENGIADEQNTEEQQKPPFRGLPELELAGDTPLIPADAQKILDILELSVASLHLSPFTDRFPEPTRKAYLIECFLCLLSTPPSLALQSPSRAPTPCVHCLESHHSIPSVYSAYVATLLDLSASS